MSRQTPDTLENFGRNFIVHFQARTEVTLIFNWLKTGATLSDSIDVANLFNDYFIHAVPTHMSNLQPEAFKTHSSVIAIEQKTPRKNKFFIH